MLGKMEQQIKAKDMCKKDIYQRVKEILNK